MACNGGIHKFIGNRGGIQQQCDCGQVWWDSKDRTIATLTAERDDWQKSCAAYGNANMALIAERDTALAIIAELREALARKEKS